MDKFSPEKNPAKELPANLILLICDKVLVYVYNPSLHTYVNVFDTFNAPQLPFFNPPMVIVGSYGLAQGEFRHYFEIQDKTGEVLVRSKETKFFLDNRTAHHNEHAMIIGVKFDHPGVYWVKSFIDGEEMAKLPLIVNYKPPQVKRQQNDEETNT